MMQRKVKPPPGVGPGRSAELRVFRGPPSTAHESRLPGAPLRRQRSLTNLSVLTDAEKKLRLCGPDWCDDLSAVTPPRNHNVGPPSPAMSRVLSRSEHSLLQPRTPSRIPRGPYAEVKPLSKTSDTTTGGPPAEDPTKEPSEDKKAFLKVDPELVVTVLGDLEQLLFSQMLDADTRSSFFTADASGPLPRRGQASSLILTRRLNSSDPETQRKRTVQNVLDLRQNLEETMSSLRGSQVTHSSLDMTCYDSDDANPRSISSLSNRSSPVSWRYGQASPRLQAGEAPSLGGCRSEHGGGAWQFSHTMPLRGGSRICSITQRLELLESGGQDLKSGYGSDSDCKLAKEVTHEDDDIITSWDESSSISSGLSDASGNLSSEECNASSSLTSLPSTPTASRRSSTIALRTDSEKRSLADSGLSWHSESEERGPRKMEYDSGSLKSEHGSSRWRREKNDDSAKSNIKKPVSLGQPLRKGKNPPVGVTSPITQTGQAVSKGGGAKPEQKAVDKSKLTLKTSGLQRSSSDAGRDPRSPDTKKPPSGINRPGSSFGYKKPTAPSSPLTGNSATLGKMPKSSGIPVKPASGSVSGNRKTSLDVTGVAEPGFLSPSARTNIQYRSLPRPAKSSSISVTGGRSAGRPLSSSVDASLVPVQGKSMGTPSTRLKEPSKVGGGRLGVNQTDREKEKAKAKAVAQDTECRANAKVDANMANVKEGAPTTPHRATAKPFIKTPALSNLDKVNSNSLDFTPCVTDLVPSKQLEVPTGVACLTPSPAPILNINSASFSQGLNNFRMYPKLSGLHRSMESLPLTISVPPAQYTGDGDDQTPDTGWNDSNLKSPAPECSVQDRNTLPKKGLRYQSHSQDEPKERRHSHTIGGIQDNSDDLSPLPPPLPLTNLGKKNLACLVSPSSAPRIARSSSIPAQDSSFELFSSSNLGSSLSLADRPKGTMTRSGSFKDPPDDVHGSVLSLASSASSTYSSAEERMQSEQIRKLRRELESSQEKVAALTTQLSANDSELVELRETIDLLKSKNSEARDVIQGALNLHDPAPRELRIRRQNSSDSISSLNSISSHCSAGSVKDSDNKKKKKKSWLRSSFNKAFSMKKGPKSATSYSDIEEMATPDSSAPTSPKQHHRPPGPESPSLHSSPSSSVIFEAQEGEEPEKREVSKLRSELWEKEMKLTDIRLEALNSAHQLEQLRETMHNMQLEVDLLKAENDRLKVVPPSVPTINPSASPRRSLALTLNQSLGISASSDTDFSPIDGVNGSLQREVTLRTVVRVPPQHIIKGDLKQQEFHLGYVKISNKADWKSLDDAVCQIFLDYVNQVDPGATLGLGRDSLTGYNLGHVKRDLDSHTPDTLPSRNLRSTTNIILHLKGLKERCVDLLVFESLIPKPMLQHYVSLLLKHRRLLLSGPSGTGKSFLAHRLAEYLVERSGREVTEGIVTAFNMHQQSCKDLQLYLSNLANQIDRETGPCDVPLVILLDDVSESGAISELVNGALTCKYHKCPYIIGTTNQPVKMSPNHGLHISFRMLTFSNNVEPANGFLGRYLRRKLLESEGSIGTGHGELLKVLDWVPRLWYHLHTFLEKHSTPDFLIGPCFFLSCPIGIEDFRVWFIDLWNNSIIPYLSEGAKDGLKVHGQRAAWEDPVEWVRGTLPWPLAQQDQSKLLHLPQPTVGTSLSASPPREHIVKESPPASLESDPLMAMLLKLQEAANYIESPDQETMCDGDLSSTI
ncbi:neuron navigator 1 isoform X3 [Bufo gargarizans]|uniref:neuron navigator 1 isoform X3 n=1 Tax=Bufo gargarizans TaxID=30331 RepID=UPI001CF383AF|nr:neuron navigator 1 isoform X3 [Bufo gargarizans]